jgi:ABC-type uncharacterized transport system ATPase subunit
MTDLLAIRDKLNVAVRELSLGERMKMELIASLLHRPKVLFLDEPTIGLDVVSQKTVREFLREHNAKEKTTGNKEEETIGNATSKTVAIRGEACDQVLHAGAARILASPTLEQSLSQGGIPVRCN